MQMQSLFGSRRALPRKQAPEKRLAVIDCETDPFQTGSTLRPFAWGFYDGIKYYQVWGRDSTKQLLAFLKELPDAYQIYAHNGGRFDFYYFLDQLQGTPLIINQRIVDAELYQHTVSDSYARIPVKLSRFGGKKEIEYWKLEARHRTKHKAEILDYLRADCVSLFDVIASWRQTFGAKTPTMASAAFKACSKIMKPYVNGSQPFQRLSPQEDRTYRPFYLGGRVQCFANGIVEADAISMHDCNSMYPSVMRKYQHPLGASATWRVTPDLTERTDFAIIEGWSKGALPLKTDSGVKYPSAFATFHATGHEIRAALECDRLRINRVIMATECDVRSDFAPFVDSVYSERLHWKALRAKDDAELKRNPTAVRQHPEAIMHDEFCKLRLNSCYGKFGMNPESYKDYVFLGPNQMPPDAKEHVCPICYGASASGRTECYYCNGAGKVTISWELSGIRGDLRIWQAPKLIGRNSYINVATAASITGAARAELLRALCRADRPLYCDTDSVTNVGDIAGLHVDSKQLGAWKQEAIGQEMALAGKKIYALFGEDGADQSIRIARQRSYGDPRCIKLACKGARMMAGDIRSIALGAAVTSVSSVPTYGLRSGLTDIDRPHYQSRTIRNTNALEGIAPFPDVLTRSDLNGLPRYL